MITARNAARWMRLKRVRGYILISLLIVTSCYLDCLGYGAALGAINHIADETNLDDPILWRYIVANQFECLFGCTRLRDDIEMVGNLFTVDIDSHIPFTDCGILRFRQQ